jgi:shikimate dehydrogenase
MNNIDGSTKLLGLIGKNISYTQSPAIHNFSAKYLGLNTVYLPFDLPPSAVEKFLDVFWNLGGIGLNITTPHKELVSTLTKNSDLSSVNTLYRGEKSWVSTSTDIEGLALGISHLGVDLHAFTRIVVLGNGGVVSALVDYLSKRFKSTPEVFILRRNLLRDENFRKPLAKGFKIDFLDFDPGAFARLVQGASGETLVLQATNAPQQGDRLEAFAPHLQRFNGVLVDLNYKQTSALLDKARMRGIPCQDGLPMLVEQARASQMLWWQKAAPYKAIIEHLQSGA